MGWVSSRRGLQELGVWLASSERAAADWRRCQLAATRANVNTTAAVWHALSVAWN